MFGGKRRVREPELHTAEPGSGSVDVALLDERSESGDSGQRSLTLSTACTCGHPRRDHLGLRMDIGGPCLECDCQEFTRVNDTLVRLRAAVAQAERLQETASGIRARLTREPTIYEPPPNHRNGNGNGHA